MKNIVLFGFMGCGKSTVGQLLAQQTGRTLLDTDSFLEQKYGRRIADIFAEDGEEAFRAMETAVCRELSDRRGLILCCGGGTVLREENAAILSQGGTMVFLDIPFAAAYARICGSDRPLVRNNSKEALEQITSVLTTEEEQRELQQLQGLWEILEAAGCGDSVRLDFSVGNNMGYYSGVVFRGYLEGIPASVLSGGQYDKLPQKMGRNAKAIGFAVYLDFLENREEEAFDVDTLILHDGSAEPLVLTAAAAEAAKKGTVLVTRELPDGRNWKHLLRFEKGAWVQ